jgi:hypothetical protein
VRTLDVYATNPGGFGIGIGVPLALRTATPGGFGIGIGVPLALRTATPGGFGIGIGVPLLRAGDAPTARLLNNCLTELLTGSRIEIAKTQSDRRIEMIFFMVESLLRPTMKENWKY